MANEIANFIKVSFSVLASTCYCYAVGRIVPKGTARLLCLLPIVGLFLYLPLHLHTIYLSGLTAFFIAWLANFKILLFAFGEGPLSSDPSISLASFVFVACFPIRIQQKPSPRSPRVLIGLELEPPFNEPYLSTSLQDFWGRRWNLIVSSILRPAVYKPTRNLASRVVGRKWALIPAFMGTFLVSGLMHELILFYYVECDQRSPWEVTCFFLLHGVCLLTEIALKKRFGGRWQLPRLVTGPLTIGFVLFTGFQLFLPSLDRCKAFEKAYVELAALMAFLGKESQRLADYLVRIPHYN
ncbi:acyl-CoA--sterol O-acyltransferase 1-like [Populus alba x Populus x berolinensis]|uniref:Acyl-CoA--sterol O-acyltransferase 1-like n=1 Tax=Populus alba x Populus x berolinensis TaxID=444605 RepID=A0AAD6RUZ8_9ROSI|nr:acyl-CoA--sterol O-acyltransferase 1-like [Populus alba x Populus x berolinensis]